MKTEIYQTEGYQFMGAAFEVYNAQGYGMAEEIYQESLEIELELQRVGFQTKPELHCLSDISGDERRLAFLSSDFWNADRR